MIKELVKANHVVSNKKEGSDKVLNVLTPRKPQDGKVYVTYCTWNLNHFNSTFDEPILNKMADTMADFDIIGFVEVSGPKKKPPFDELIKLLEAKSELPYDYIFHEMNGSYWGAVVFKKIFVKLGNKDKEPLIVDWQRKHMKERDPLTYEFSVEKSDKSFWNFYVSLVHLKSDLSNADLQMELQNLSKIHEATKGGDLIIMGDFNFKVGWEEDKNRDKLVMNAIAKISCKKNDPFEALILEPSMTSKKLHHCNDSILVPKSLIDKHAPPGKLYQVIAPKGAPILIGDYSVIRTKDHTRESFALFTDHYPVSAILCADEIKRPETVPISLDM